MKKVLLLLALVCLLGVSSQAQEILKKGDIVVDARIGLGGGGYYKMALPPISITGEYCIVDNLIAGKNGSIGVGAYVGVAGYRHKGFYDNYYHVDHDFVDKMFRMTVGARAAFHYQFIDKLDTYAGIMLGLDIRNYKEFYCTSHNYVDDCGYYKNTKMGLAHSEFVGARYYFTDNIAVNAEFGYGISYFSVGASFKL